MDPMADNECSATAMPEALAHTSGPSPTPRETEIIQLLAEGRSNKQIANELGISVRTVEAHRAHVMRKLHLPSLVELLYYAMDHGIVGKRNRPT